MLNPDETVVIHAVADATKASVDFTFTCASAQASGVLEQTASDVLDTAPHLVDNRQAPPVN